MKGKKYTQLSADPAVQHIRKNAKYNDIDTGFDRFQSMQDSCGFGELGLCCRNCMMGPCRINPFGEEPSKGICGISADGIVARNLCRMVATGTASHSDHGMHIFEVIEKICKGEKSTFEIKNKTKLLNLSTQYGFKGDEKNETEQLEFLIDLVRKTFSGGAEENVWLKNLLPEQRSEKLKKLNIYPNSIDPIIRTTLHRTHYGVDADPDNLLYGALKCSLADISGMDIASNLTDMLLGAPKLAYSQTNLGVLDIEAVNVAVHGHHPLVSSSILKISPEFDKAAKEAGAENGINIVGVCCTGNELLTRYGIPLATNAASQEIAILTGVVDAMVVDVQCIMPSLADICECFHTKLITTMSIAKIPGAMHVEFEPDTADETARTILQTAIDAYKKRNPKKIDVPDIKQETLVGFSFENIVDLLSKIDSEKPLTPLIENIASGNIKGVVLLAGCNNYKVMQDYNFITMAKILAENNVLMLATGCAAGGLGKAGFLSPDATKFCGDGLKAVLTSLGEVAGLNRPLPPVWHMGSCVDNSRVIRVVTAIANELGVDIDKLPVVASVPEIMSEKAMAISTSSVAFGITTHLGVIPPVMGGKHVTNMLTEGLKETTGSSFILETDPIEAAQKIIDHINDKRKVLLGE